MNNNPNIDFYNDNADKLVEQYNSLSTKDFHGHILHLVKPNSVILDVGCGSGRDAYYFAENGHTVVAIDPADTLLSKAKEKFNHENIIYLKDKLPELNEINRKFDFILLSAVWMHIPQEDRSFAFKRLTSLLKPEGKMVISLRFGPFFDGRKELPVSEKELQSFTSELKNFSAVNLDGNDNKEDKLKRDEVSWQTIVISNNNLKPQNKIKYK